MSRTPEEIEASRATVANSLTVVTFVIITVGLFVLMKKKFMDIIEDLPQYTDDDDKNNLANLVLVSSVVSAVLSVILHFIAYRPLAETSITE
jgi:hypothetical protein